MKTVTFTDTEINLMQGMAMIFKENTEKAIKKHCVPAHKRKCEEMLKDVNSILIKITYEV